VITKELLSEVLNEKITEIKPIQPTKRLLYFRVMIGKYEEIFGADINIYELAHKCKGWAWENGYIIENYFAFGDGICKVFNTRWERIYKCIEDTEQEAIFKACQWILENKDKQ